MIPPNKLDGGRRRPADEYDMDVFLNSLPAYSWLGILRIRYFETTDDIATFLLRQYPYNLAFWTQESLLCYLQTHDLIADFMSVNERHHRDRRR